MTIQYKRPPMYAKQLAAIFPENVRFTATEASTKSGKTHACINWIFEQAIKAKDFENCWWVAPVYRQAKIAFRRLKYGLRALADQIEVNETELYIRIIGAGTIWFLSGDKPDNLYGDDVVAVVIDEASRCREESWFAVFSTLTATEGLARLIGNVTDRNNWFYKLCRNIENGVEGYEKDFFHYSKIVAQDAVDAGILKPRVLKIARTTLPEDVYKALYECIPASDGANPFGEEHIQTCIIPQMSVGTPVVFGVDLARQLDETVIIGLDKDMNVCVHKHFKLDWKTTCEVILAETYGIPTLIDSTTYGDPILEALQEADRFGCIEGYWFSAPAKQNLMMELAVAIQGHKVGFPEGDIPKQLRTVTYEIGKRNVLYSVPKGYHDDNVMALALAVHKFEEFGYSWELSPEELVIMNG